MLSVSCPQLCSVCGRARGNQSIRNLDSMASSVLPKVDARLTTRFFVDWNTCQRPEKIVQSGVFIRPGAGPEFSHTDRRIEHGGVSVAQVYPLGNDVRIPAARDFNEDVGINKDRHFLGSRSRRLPRRRLRIYSNASQG